MGRKIIHKLSAIWKIVKAEEFISVTCNADGKVFMSRAATPSYMRHVMDQLEEEYWNTDWDGKEAGDVRNS